MNGTAAVNRHLPDDWEDLEHGIIYQLRDHDRSYGRDFLRALHCRVEGSRQFMRLPSGHLAWAVDARIYETEIQPCVDEIYVLDLETGVVYRVSVLVFNMLKVEVDGGQGREYCLALNRFSTFEQDQPGSSYLVCLPRL